jgi:hypothetical protein
MAVGGGLDIRINSVLSVRPVEVNYLLTRLVNNITTVNNQNSFRYAAGVAVNF